MNQLQEQALLDAFEDELEKLAADEGLTKEAFIGGLINRLTGRGAARAVSRPSTRLVQGGNIRRHAARRQVADAAASSKANVQGWEAVPTGQTLAQLRKARGA